MKRGQIEALALISFLFVTGGIIFATATLSDDTPSILAEGITGFVVVEPSQYVGDVRTQKFYELSCAQNIPSESRIYIHSLDVARHIQFTYSPTC